MGGMRSAVTHRYVASGSIEFTLDSPMHAHGRNALVSLEVQIIDRFYVEWKPLIQLRDTPRNGESGTRTFGFDDPFGNTLFLIGPPGELELQ